jgi:hypothetical protein
MRESEAQARPVSFRVEMEARLHSGAEPLRLTGWLAWESATHLATAVTWKSEFGELSLHAVRDDQGLRVRERTPFGDERVFRVVPEQLARLAPATTAEVPAVGRMTGSRILTERAPRLRWTVAAETEVDGVACVELTAVLDGPADPASLLPDRAQLWVGRDDLVVRRLIESRGADTLQRIDLTEVRVGAIDPVRWEFPLAPDAVIQPLVEDADAWKRLKELLYPGAARAATRRAGADSRTSQPARR